MARGFNLTAQLNLRGPSNIRTVVADIRREIGTIDANVNLKFDPKVTGNISSLNSALKSLNSTLTSSTSALGSASAAMRDFGNSVNLSNIKNFPQQVNNSASAVTKLGSSSRSASKDMVVATNQMQEFGNQSALAIRRFAAFTAVTTIIFGVTNAINKGVQEIISFDKEMVTLQQITGESRAGLKGLSDNITLLATSLGVSSHELVDISSTLAQAGLSARETEQAIRALALSSLAPSFNDMNDTVEGSIALMKQFNISALQLEGALGSINSVAAKFAVEAGDIITAIQRTGGVFATASQGVSEGTDALNEFIAVFTSVRATTRESAETIATGLRTIFTRIQRGDTIEALKAYGVNLQDLDGKFVGAYKAVELLSRGLSGLDPRDVSFSRIIEELGGFRQIGKVIPLIQQFSVAQAALKVAQQGQGSLAKDATTAQLSLGNQMAKVREQFLALAKDIGSSVTFQTMIKGAIGLAGALVSVGSSIKGILPSLAILLAFKGAGAIAGFASGFFGGRGATKKQEGGRIMKFARGGFVPGTGDGDTVPAMLEPGEFVIRKKAVETLGAGNLHRMNKSGGGSIRVGGYAGGGTVQKFAGGGIASFGGSTAKGTILLSDNQQNTKTQKPTQLGLSKDNFNYNTFDQETITIKQDDLPKNKFTGKYKGTSKPLTKVLVNALFNNDTASAEAWEKIVAKLTGSIHVGGSENYGYPIDSVNGNLLYDAKFKLPDSETVQDGNNKALNYYLTKTLKGYNFKGGKGQTFKLAGDMLGRHKLNPTVDTIDEPYKFEFVYPLFENILTDQSSIKEGIDDRLKQRKTLDKRKKNRERPSQVDNYMREGFIGRTEAQQKRFDKEQRHSKHVDEAIEFYTEKDNKGNITPKNRVSGNKQIINHIKQYKSSKKAAGGEIQRFGKGSVYPVDAITNYQDRSREINAHLTNLDIKEEEKEHRKYLNPTKLADIEDTIKKLDSSPKTKTPDNLYTGIGENRLDIIKQKIGNKLQSQKDVDSASGKTFALPGFLSTSKSQKVGMNFSQRGLLNIKTKKGATGIDVNTALPEKMLAEPHKQKIQEMLREEQEIILPRSTQLKIIKASANYNSANMSTPVPWTDPSYDTRHDPFYSMDIQQLGIGGVAKAKMVEAKIPLRDMYRRLAKEGRLDGTGITDKDFVSRVPNKHDDLMNRLVIDSFAAETAHAQKAIKGSELFGLVGLIGKTKHTSLGPEMINGKSIYTKIGMLSEKTSARLQKEMASGNASSTKNLAESMQAEEFLGSGGNLAIDFDETLVSGADIFNDKGLPDIEKYFDMKAVAEALQNAKLKSPIGTHLKEVLAGDPKFIEKIRVLSARPQTSAALIASTLNRLGIPIGADRVTGVSSPGMTSEGVATAKAKNLGYDEALIDDNLQNILAARKANKTAHHLTPVAELSEEELAITGKAEMEGYTVQQILTRLGAPAATRGAMSMDFPKGLGSVAQFFGIEDNIPTDVKRTIDSASIGKYRAEVLSFLENRDGIFGTKDSKVAKVSAKDTAGDKKNTQKSGTAVQRNLGYIDSDVLASPENSSVVGSEMAKLGITKVSDYKMHLSKLAATARNEGSLKRLSAIVGVAGSGKSSLMLGGKNRSKADKASLRQTTRSPILTPEDIASVSQIIDVTATVSPERLSGYLTSADKVYSLQSSTKEERDEIKRRKGSRDINADPSFEDTLYGRTPGSTAGAPTDSGPMQAMLASEMDPKKVRTMSVDASGFKLKNKKGKRHQGPTVETKAIALSKISASPTTPGHLSLRDAAVAEGFSIEDFIVLVGSNEAITKKDPDAHDFRTVNFDQDFRYLMAKVGFNKSIVNKAKPGFGVPDVFEGESIEEDRRHFIRPGPGSIYVAGPEKTEKQLQNYKDANYKIVQLEKRTTVEGGTEEISGTAARAAILSGDIPAMRKFLSPAVFDIVQKNLTQLQNRDKVLPEIMKGVNSRKDLSLVGIEKEISDLLGGPTGRLQRKKYEHDPEYQKMADHVDDLRESKRKIESHASFEPFALMRKLAEEFPEKYGLSLTGAKASLGDTVDLQQSVQAKSPSITPGITSTAKPIKRGIGGGIPKLGKEVYDLQKATGLNNFEFDRAKQFGDTMGYDILQFKRYLAEIVAQKKSKAGMKIDPKALAESLKVPGKTSTSAQLALAGKLKGPSDAAYTPRPSIAEDMASVNRITRGYAIGGAVSDTVPALLTPGEFVINKKAAESIGYGQLRRMNHADKIQGFAKGGSVGNIQKFADGDIAEDDDILGHPFDNAAKKEKFARQAAKAAKDDAIVEHPFDRPAKKRAEKAAKKAAEKAARDAAAGIKMVEDGSTAAPEAKDAKDDVIVEHPFDKPAKKRAEKAAKKAEKAAKKATKMVEDQKNRIAPVISQEFEIDEAGKMQQRQGPKGPLGVMGPVDTVTHQSQGLRSKNRRGPLEIGRQGSGNYETDSPAKDAGAGSLAPLSKDTKKEMKSNTALNAAMDKNKAAFEELAARLIEAGASTEQVDAAMKTAARAINKGAKVDDALNQAKASANIIRRKTKTDSDPGLKNANEEVNKQKGLIKTTNKEIIAKKKTLTGDEEADKDTIGKIERLEKRKVKQEGKLKEAVDDQTYEKSKKRQALTTRREEHKQAEEKANKSAGIDLGGGEEKKKFAHKDEMTGKGVGISNDANIKALEAKLKEAQTAEKSRVLMGPMAGPPTGDVQKAEKALKAAKNKKQIEYRDRRRDEIGEKAGLSGVSLVENKTQYLEKKLQKAKDSGASKKEIGDIKSQIKNVKPGEDDRYYAIGVLENREKSQAVDKKGKEINKQDKKNKKKKEFDKELGENSADNMLIASGLSSGKLEGKRNLFGTGSDADRTLTTLENTKTENLGKVIKLPELQIKNLEKSFTDAGVKSSQLSALVAKGGNISLNTATKAIEADIKRARAAGASIATIEALDKHLTDVRLQGEKAVAHAASIKGSQQGFIGRVKDMSSDVMNSRAAQYIGNSLPGRVAKGGYGLASSAGTYIANTPVGRGLGMAGSTLAKKSYGLASSAGEGLQGQGGMFLSMGLGMASGQGETFFGKKNSSKEAAASNAAFESGMGTMSAGIGVASQVAMIPGVGPALAGVVAVGTAMFAVADGFYDFTGAQKAATDAFEQQARDKTVAAASANLGAALDKLSKNTSDVNAQRSAMSNIKTMNSTQSTSLSKQIDISKNERTLGQFLLGRSKKGISNEEIRDMAVTDAGSEASQRKAQGARSLIEIGIKGGKSLEDISKGPDSQALGEALARSDPATAEKLARMDEVSKNNPKLREENEIRKQQIYKEAIVNDPALKASVTMIALEKSAKASALAGKKLSDTFESMAEKIHQSVNNTVHQLDAMSVAEQSYIDGLEGKSKVGAFKSESLNILNNPKAFSKDQVAQANATAANMLGGGKTSRDVAAIANLGNTMNTKAADAVKGVAAGNANVDIKGGIGAARAAGIDEIRKSGASADIQEQLISQLNSELDNLAHKFEQQQNAGGQVDIQELYNGIQNSTKLVGDQGAKLFAEVNKATLALREGAINKFNDSVNAASERLQKAFNYQQKATTIMGSTRRQINEIKTGDKEDFYDIAIRKKQETRTLTGGPTNAADIRANIENLNRRRQAQQEQLKATTEANMVTAGALGPNSNATAAERTIAQNNNNAMIQQTVALDETNRALANSHTALENLANDADIAAVALSSLQNIKGLQQSTIQYSKKLLSTSPEEAKKLAASFGRLTNNMNGFTNSSKNSEEAQKAYMDELKSSGNAQKATMAGQAVIASQRGADLQNFEESKPRRELALKNEQAAKVEAMRQQSGGVINLEAEQQMLKQQGLTDSDIRQKLNAEEATVMEKMGIESGLDKSPEFQKDVARLRDPNADAAMRVAEQNAMATAQNQATANQQMGLLNISMANLTAAIDRLNSSIPMLQQNVQQQGLAAGGVVYASAGQSINFQSRGTDTVPAMLTPGEFVVNRQSSSKNLPILQAINSGHYDRGGIVNYLNNGGSAGMKYFAAGSMVPNSPNSIGGVSNNVDTQQMQKDMESFKRTVDTLGEFIKGFAESTTTFTTSTEDMSSSISNFVQGAKEIPQELNITGSMTNKTQVDFKGAEVFTTLEPSFAKLAETNLINAMTNLNMGLEGSLFQGDAKSIIGKGKKG